MQTNYRFPLILSWREEQKEANFFNTIIWSINDEHDDNGSNDDGDGDNEVQSLGGWMY